MSRSKNKKRITKKPLPVIIGAVLALFVAVILIGAAGNFLSRGSAIKIVSAQSVFQSNENPQFVFVYEKQANIFSRLFASIKDFFSSNTIEITATVRIVNAKGEEVDGLNPQINRQSNGKFTIDLDHSKFQQELRPGKYKMQLEIKDGDKIYTQEQEFVWGVLAINTNKSIYTPGEEAYLQFAALTDDGTTICAANLQLKIQDTRNKIQTLSTEDGTIEYSKKCWGNNVTDVPDYFAYYQVDKPGKYQMTLTNLDNGYEITDYFSAVGGSASGGEVQESVAFDVERIGPTRIYPKADYEMKIIIKANQDFKGEIIETVPMTFAITPTNRTRPEQKPNIDKYTKTTTWQTEIKKGETKEFSYTFDAPNVSPYFYLFGPLKMLHVTGYMFQESRQWQIAADSENEIFITYDEAPSGSCGPNCWTVPGDWNSASNSVEVIGGGGTGGDGTTSNGAGGGGGGGYSKVFNLDITGDITFGVGASGSQPASGGIGGAGGHTWFNSSSYDQCAIDGPTICVSAEGGEGGGGSSVGARAGGIGGGTASASGTVKYSGGNGGAGSSSDGSGGGGGAGGPHATDGAGKNGGSSASVEGGGGGGAGGGSATVGSPSDSPNANEGGDGGAGYSGAAGGDGAATPAVGGDGTIPGAGGGGGDQTTTSTGTNGGKGAIGQQWDSTHGSGGGGGGAGDSGASGGTGGNYGGGGGGAATCTTNGNCKGAGGLIHIAYTPASKTISGTCYLANQQNTCADCPGCIKVAVNGTLDDASGDISGGSWTITLTNTTPAAGNPITVFKSGVADSIEAAAVTKWVSGSTLSGVVLYNMHLNIGHTGGAQTISNADIATYDNSVAAGNEDVFFESAGENGLLQVCYVSGCESAELYILAGNTYSPSTSGISGAPDFALKTHNIEIDGTFVMQYYFENGIASISGSWDNDSVFTANSSTIFFTATSSEEIVSASQGSTVSFYNVQFGDDATTSYSGKWTLNGASTPFDVDNNLEVQAGEFIQGNYDVTTTTVSIASRGKWTNIGTGDLTLGGIFINNGLVVFNTNNNGCTNGGTTDDIVISSSVPDTQRNWTGTGGFEMFNVSVTDMTSTPQINVYSGTPDNAGDYWVFFDCPGSGNPYNTIRGNTRIKGGTRLK